jgi:hypothetical protein
MNKSRYLRSGSIVLAALAMGAAHAQMRLPAGESAAISSSPGKAAIGATIDRTAKVTAIDKNTRTITLQGSRGGVMDVVASDEVRNFDQIRVGDTVETRYQPSVTLELKKSKGTTGSVETTTRTRAAPGERPGGSVARETQVTAEVVEVDPGNSKIALKGPKGRVVELQVLNPDHFAVVKKGDYVDVVYSEALAIAVKPTGK